MGFLGCRVSPRSWQGARAIAPCKARIHCSFSCRRGRGQACGGSPLPAACAPPLGAATRDHGLPPWRPPLLCPDCPLNSTGLHCAFLTFNACYIARL